MASAACDTWRVGGSQRKDNMLLFMYGHGTGPAMGLVICAWRKQGWIFRSLSTSKRGFSVVFVNVCYSMRN